MFAIRYGKWGQALPAAQAISQFNHCSGKCVDITMRHDSDSRGQSRRVRQIGPTRSIRADDG
jgi:hypothetical protein